MLHTFDFLHRLLAVFINTLIVLTSHKDTFLFPSSLLDVQWAAVKIHSGLMIVPEHICVQHRSWLLDLMEIMDGNCPGKAGETPKILLLLVSLSFPFSNFIGVGGDGAFRIVSFIQVIWDSNLMDREREFLKTPKPKEFQFLFIVLKTG